MSYTTVQLKVTTVGGGGVAVGSARKGISPGRLVGIQVVYNAGAPGTTDITFKQVAGGVESTLLTISGDNTDIPLQAFTNKPINADGAQVGNAHVPPKVSGELLLEVTACDALTDAVAVTGIIEV